MAHLFTQVTMQRVTQLPEDVIVNTFHWDTGAPAPVSIADATSVTVKLQNFYTAIAGLLSGVIAGTGHAIKCYDMADEKPRQPFFTSPLTLAPTGATLPAEIALCLSFRGPVQSGGVPARRRGRVYIGPLDTAILGLESVGDAKPTGPTLDTILNAAKTLVDASGPKWSVYSEVNDLTVQGDNGLVPVRHIWMDNAFDIQRRRGADPNDRRTRDAAAT